LKIKTKRDRDESQKIVSELRQKDDYRDWIRRVLSAFQYELVSLSLIQTRARLDTITLVPTSITSEESFKIASENRLDWMNRRASLVDTWRQIDLAAHQLKGDLNVTVDGEIGTIDKRGVRFDGDNGRLRIGLNWDSPLTRHNEMLDYRRTQVEYQAARRDYYTYVDSVNAELRRVLRNTELYQLDFEFARNAVLIATSRVDVWQLKMEQPPARGQKIETTTATQLIGALNVLMTSQNEFLNTWVSYQTQRMLLDLNMGTMELDTLGRWIDPGIITKNRSVTKTEQPIQKLTPKRRIPHRHLAQRKLSDPSVPPAPRLNNELNDLNELEELKELIVTESENKPDMLPEQIPPKQPKPKLTQQTLIPPKPAQPKLLQSKLLQPELVQPEPSPENKILQTSWKETSTESSEPQQYQDAPLPPQIFEHKITKKNRNN
jgi:hypothetical protein